MSNNFTKRRRLHPEQRSNSGIALVLVLAFVVLLTGLIVAFFSRAMSERQVSNSSANQTKAEMFAQGAIDATISDFKQEIAAGSTITTPSPSPAAGSLYTPKAPSTAVPALQGFTATTGLENLVKVSVNQKPFYSGASYTTGTYPPPGDTANVVASRSRAAGPSTDTTTTAVSLNGRSVSKARWNKPLLIPKLTPTSDTDYTPVAAFPVPDWIVVGRNGTNPALFYSGNATKQVNLTTATGYAVGRYAYAVYDEGGLLDMNAAGYPAANAADPTGVSALQASSKMSLPFADLTVLKDATGITTLLSQSKIDDFVGWRNFASGSTDWTKTPMVLSSPALVGPFPFSGTAGWGAAPAAGTNYYNFVLQNSAGFLKTINPLLNGGQSDRLLASRQELMKIFLQKIASQAATAAGIADRASTQTALQYMGTFSRGINQPDFMPDSTRPLIAAVASGGNDQFGKDNTVNPSFLAVRVGTTKAAGRSDGTDLKVGEPLAKSRFNLNRLAWVTYLGPLADGSGAAGSSTVNGNPTIQALADKLNNTYGLSYAFLRQGTAANIKSCLGLQWALDNSTTTGLGDNTSKWFYNAHLYTVGVAGTGTGAKGPVMNLSEIAALSLAAKQHEPDFFELLKASIVAGSLGKSATTGAVGTAGGTQYSKDISVDASIIQIGANMIDQFDADGYPTRVIFDDGTWGTAPASVPQEYRGVEDLPYFYRVRRMYFPLKDSDPVMSYKPVVTPSTPGFPAQPGDPFKPTEKPFLDSGFGVVFQAPEIWNPHAWKTTNPATGARPTVFRLCAIDAVPGSLSPPSPDTNASAALGRVRDGTLGYCDSTLSPAVILKNFTMHSLSFTPDSTGLIFTIPFDNSSAVALADPTKTRLDLFREPTFLIKPGIPEGSKLHFSGDPAGVVSEPKNQVFNTSLESASPPGESLVQPFLTAAPVAGTNPGGFIGLKSLVTGDYPTGYVNNQLWLGIYSGTFPLKWQDTKGGTDWVLTANTCFYSGTGVFTYQLQYQDASGKWITFDEKFTGQINGGGLNTGGYKNPDYLNWKLMGNNSDGLNLSYVDPRTSRFGGFNNNYAYNVGGDTMNAWSSTSTLNPQLAGAQQSAMRSERIDETNMNNLRSQTVPAGWYLAAGDMKPGLVCQNNVNITSPQVQFFADPDTVVRRGMSAYVQPAAAAAAVTRPGGTPAPAPIPATTTAASGIPLTVATDYSTASATTTASQIANEAPSRPIVLNRPFRTVSELGYVFSGTPWRNLDFFTPESGNTSMLDTFCINDTDDLNVLVAGKVNLNTRQAPVLQAILAGAYKDEFASSTIPATGSATAATADSIAKALVARTSDTANVAIGSGPLKNVSELVGKFVTKSATAAASTLYDGSLSYAGFSGTSATTVAPPTTPANLSSVLSGDTTTSGYYATANTQRYRESVMRPLTAVGQTRVWNVMIDIIAQTGRYPSTATTLQQFIVEGEQRYWVHVAIDRLTGQVLDKQVELVKE